MSLSTSIPPYGDHVVAPRETDLEDILSIGKEEARRRERKICSSSNSDDADLGGHDSSEAFFVVDVGCIQRKYHRWRQCFPRIKPFYAMKVNPHPVILRALASLEYCGFDCSSPAEISLALDCGAEPKNIIYANPCKPLDDIKFAINCHVRTMTFDGTCELHKIRRTLDTMRPVPSEAVPNEEEELDVDLLLRIRVPDKTSTTPLGEKFGATFEECTSLARAHCCLLQKQANDTRSNCPPIIMSDQHSERPWLENHRGQFPLWQWISRCRSIWSCSQDGKSGGFPGWDGSEPILEGCLFPHPLSLEDIADATNPVLSELFTGYSDIQFIAEPGRYFVEASHTLFARVYVTRPLRLRDENSDGRSPTWQHYTACFIGEGVYGCFKDKILCGIDYELMTLKLSTEEEKIHADENDDHQCQQQPKGDCVFIGPAWRESDIVCLPSTQNDCPMPTLHQGDWVYAARMGAYTSSIAYNHGAVANSVCIQHSPPIYVVELRNSHFQ